mmetsp:Transcript_101/g.786  ORF Transcript_101/g.786 Transcript_101/m.786 type:complete len:161 (+) Transcript_101:297-779(+)
MKENETTAPHIIGFRVVGGPVKGKEYNKKWGRRITVGRTARSHLHVKDPEVSEKHAEIQWNGKSWMFKDVGSSNGTEINGVTLKEGEPHALQDGDKITLGSMSQVVVSIESVQQESISVEDYLVAECDRLVEEIQGHAEIVSSQLMQQYRDSAKELKATH